MLSVLVEGTLVAAPMRRTSQKGSAFVTAQMRTTCDDGESILCSVIAFSASAADALLRLGAGDTVAVTGPASISRWDKGGETHVGLKVTATRVLTIYEAGMRRRAASQPQAQPDRPTWQGPAAQRGRDDTHERDSAQKTGNGRSARPTFDDLDEGPV